MTDEAGASSQQRDLSKSGEIGIILCDRLPIYTGVGGFSEVPSGGGPC